MSFDERAPSRLSGLLSKVLAAVAVVALLAAVGLGALFLASNRSSPSPSPEASPSPRPTPTVALQRFRTLAANPKRAYHVKFAMTADSAGTRVETRAELDVSGSDWKGTLTVISGGKTVRTETIGKAGKIYSRTPSGKWRIVPMSGAAQATDPFGPVAARDTMNDMGVVKRAGKMLHWLHTRERPSGDEVTKRLGLTGTLDSYSLDVYVSDTGLPVEAAARMTVSAPTGTTTVTMTYAISRFGKAVTITAPRT
jgi:hypothetical protein